MIFKTVRTTNLKFALKKTSLLACFLKNYNTKKKQIYQILEVVNYFLACFRKTT